MALFTCNMSSEVLKMNTMITVILPQEKALQAKPLPTLYLLHGYSGDHSDWVRYTSIERYANERGIAVVMPRINNSFYTDMVHGDKYWTFLSEELPKLSRAFFPLSDKREENFVAGLSMGGYGAIKWALRKPGQFIAAASMSGALDLATPISEERERDFIKIFGEEGPAGTENDLLYLLEQFAGETSGLPAIYQCCGTDDFLYEQNQAFRKACQKIELDLTYAEGPGDHNWAYWDARIKDVLEWLPVRGA